MTHHKYTTAWKKLIKTWVFFFWRVLRNWPVSKNDGLLICEVSAHVVNVGEFSNTLWLWVQALDISTCPRSAFRFGPHPHCSHIERGELEKHSKRRSIVSTHTPGTFANPVGAWNGAMFIATNSLSFPVGPWHYTAKINVTISTHTSLVTNKTNIL